jgi:anti-anti-sigma regulatory factor
MPAIHLVEHDWRNPHALWARISELVERETDGLIVDLAGGRVDTSLLHLLVVTDRALAARGVRMIVLCPDDQARAALRASGLDLHLSIVGELSRAADLLDPPSAPSAAERPDGSA